ncbi:MAG: metalloprotease, partial [Candidatus Methanomethylophilaceae archaeon]|nr:metalloprotease [Candidatus Methanomethylophilaceae archaeon]
MNVAYVVLLILFIIYVPIYLYVRKSEKAHNAGFVTWGPTIMIKTRWGLGMMDRIGKHKRLWNAFGAFSLVVSFLLMVT